MLDVIISNKEWVFSGIGVFAIGGLIAFFRKKASHTKDENKYRQTIKSGNNSKNIQSTGNVTIKIGHEERKKTRQR